MKQCFWLLILPILFLNRTLYIAPQPAQAYLDTPNPTSTPKAPVTAEKPPLIAQESQDIPSMITKYAVKYGINPKLALCIAQHESNFDPTRKGDLDGPYGVSRGLFQLNSFFHSEISDKVAYSATSSTEWSMKWIKKGHVKEWSTFNDFCKNIPVYATSL